MILLIMKYSLMHFINILITILKKIVKYGKLYYAMIVFNSFIWRNDIYDKDKATHFKKPILITKYLVYLKNMLNN